MFIPEIVNSPQLRATLRWLGDHPGRLALSPDGKLLATGRSDRGEVKLWDLAARKERATVESGLGKFTQLAFSPDGRTLAVGAYRPADGAGGLTGGVEL